MFIPKATHAHLSHSDHSVHRPFTGGMLLKQGSAWKGGYTALCPQMLDSLGLRHPEIVTSTVSGEAFWEFESKNIGGGGRV